MDKKNIRILVVDDEETLCEGLRTYLELEGYTVDASLSADDALKRDLTVYDLLLLDIMMDGISGTEMATAVRNRESTADLPIIFLTARDSLDDMVAGLKLGADDYISKPYEIKNLLARIEAEKENPQADINWGAINYNFYHQHPDLWEPYVSPNEENLDENYRNDTDGNVTYCNLSGSGCFILNNTLLKELGVEVNGYADLLQPELKGKIAMGDPTASSSAFAELTNMLLVMGEGETPAECYQSDAAWDYVDKFIDNLDGIILSSSSQVYKGVIDGEYAVGVSYEDPVVQAIIDNAENPDADLSLVYPEEGAVWLPAGVAIVKNAPNMENAKLFIDYLLSEECQTALAETTIRGTMTSIPQTNEAMKPFDEINVVYEDQKAVAEQQTSMLERWTDLLTG